MGSTWNETKDGRKSSHQKALDVTYFQSQSRSIPKGLTSTPAENGLRMLGSFVGYLDYLKKNMKEMSSGRWLLYKFCFIPKPIYIFRTIHPTYTGDLQILMNDDDDYLMVYKLILFLFCIIVLNINNTSYIYSLLSNSSINASWNDGS
jgi:hypothetical protein